MPSDLTGNANAGTVLSIRRHPVKSMIGEEIDATDFTDAGLIGDRAYALIRLETATQCRCPQLLVGDHDSPMAGSPGHQRTSLRSADWQPHTVRGAIAGALKKKLGLEVTSEKIENRGRVYRIA